MCLDPVTATIASIALGAAGSAVTGSENAANTTRMMNARNKATLGEVDRQHGFQDITGGIFDNSVGQFAPDAQQTRLQGGKDFASTLFGNNMPTAANVGTIGTKTASAYTKGAEANKTAGAMAENAERTGRIADLTGWDNYGFENRKGLNEAGLDLGVYGDLSRNSAQVGALEADVNYNNAWRPPSGLGDILSFAGTATGFAGGGGASPFSMAKKPMMPNVWNPNTASQGFIY